jgi:hypothetical protein
MAKKNNEFCDKGPCELLKKFVEAGFVSTRVEPRNLVVMIESGEGRKTGLVLYYCPFCGTRIRVPGDEQEKHDGNKEVLDWVDQRMGC